MTDSNKSPDPVTQADINAIKEDHNIQTLFKVSGLNINKVIAMPKTAKLDFDMGLELEREKAKNKIVTFALIAKAVKLAKDPELLTLQIEAQKAQSKKSILVKEAYPQDDGKAPAGAIAHFNEAYQDYQKKEAAFKKTLDAKAINLGISSETIESVRTFYFEATQEEVRYADAQHSSQELIHNSGLDNTSSAKALEKYMSSADTFNDELRKLLELKSLNATDKLQAILKDERASTLFTKSVQTLYAISPSSELKEREKASALYDKAYNEYISYITLKLHSISPGSFIIRNNLRSLLESKLINDLEEQKRKSPNITPEKTEGKNAALSPKNTMLLMDQADPAALLNSPSTPKGNNSIPRGYVTGL